MWSAILSRYLKYSDSDLSLIMRMVSVSVLPAPKIKFWSTLQPFNSSIFDMSMVYGAHSLGYNPGK